MVMNMILIILERCTTNFRNLEYHQYQEMLGREQMQKLCLINTI